MCGANYEVDRKNFWKRNTGDSGQGLAGFLRYLQSVKPQNTFGQALYFKVNCGHAFDSFACNPLNMFSGGKSCSMHRIFLCNSCA